MSIVESGDHVLCLYHDSAKINRAVKFFKDGFDKKEMVLLLTDNLSKEEFSKNVHKSWNVTKSESLEGQNIFVKSTKDGCFPEGFFDMARISKLWKTWIKHAKDLKLDGLRIFVDNSSIFYQDIQSR